MTTREQIRAVVFEVIGPLIWADGGQLHLIDVDDDSVTLHLSGRYSGCPGNTLARRRVIEPAIFAVAPGARVTITSGPIIPDGSELVAPNSISPHGSDVGESEPQDKNASAG